jgi:superfamily II DNA or RNA helicase
MADYKWQTDAVASFKDEKIAAVIAACGTGKTRVGIKLALAKMLPVVVIVPKNISRQWRDDILEVAGADQKVWLYDASAERRNPAKYFASFVEWLKPSTEELRAMQEKSNR